MKLSDIEGIGPGIKAKFEKTGSRRLKDSLKKVLLKRG